MTAQAALRIALSLCAMLMLSLAAQAQGLVRYVSSSGSDANPCTRTLPCRTLQAGVNAAPAGGEVQVLDSGEYGTLTINKAVTVSAVGVSARIVSSVGRAIDINAAGGRVVLRGLLLNGNGIGEAGVVVEAAEAVHIERCEIESFLYYGMVVNSTVTKLFVRETISRESDFGLIVFASGGKVTLDNSRFENGETAGVYLGGNLESNITRTSASGNIRYGIAQEGGRANISRSVAASNGESGYYVGSGGDMTIENSVARGNGIGLQAATTARLANSVVTNNDIGVFNSSGTVETRGNNTIAGNRTDDVQPSGSLTPLPPM